MQLDRQKPILYIRPDIIRTSLMCITIGIKPTFYVPISHPRNRRQADI